MLSTWQMVSAVMPFHFATALRVLVKHMAAWSVAPISAHAACGEVGIHCVSDFESITAVVWTGNSFVAAGQHKAEQSRATLLRVTRSGQAPSFIPITIPEKPANADSRTVEVRRLIALSDGDIVLLADIRDTGAATVRQVAWASRISPRGDVRWSRTFSDDAASLIFHSGLYDPSANTVVIVGRRTIGSDSGRCENWSQSWVLALNKEDGKNVFSAYYGEPNKGPGNRQALFDIANGPRPDSFVVAGFVTAAHASAAGRCQDNILVANLTRTGNRWSLTEAGRIGANTTDEVAFSIKALSGGSYVMAGQGRDPATGSPAAQIHRIKLNPFSIETPISRSFPADGSDKTGGDRYRIVLPLADAQRLLLGGSVSSSKDSANRAFYQIVAPDLTVVGDVAPFSDRASDLFDAAVSPEGKILAVGRSVDEANERVGWFGFIGTKADRIVRRQPDPRLPKLASLPLVGGAYRLPSTIASASTGYLGGELSAGSKIDLAFSVASRTTLRIAAHADAGDLDLALTHANGRLISFSNYGGSATELMIATIDPGDYRVAILAQSHIRSFDVRLSPTSPIGVTVLREFQKLSEEERVQLGELLADAGYTPFSNPSIAVGIESVRALLAAQEGASRPIGPPGFARSVLGAFDR